MKQLGMNMRGLFYPDIRLGVALRESQNVGLSRIEITYAATNKSLEGMLLHPLFRAEAEKHLNMVEQAIAKVDGLCWHLQMGKLL